jgi:hypothetical protein
MPDRWNVTAQGLIPSFGNHTGMKIYSDADKGVR